MNYHLDFPLPSRFPDTAYAFVEVPAGSKIKYEIHKTFSVLMCDRVLHSSVHYPLDYGFIPQTLCPDGDPADVLILTQGPLFPFSCVEIRAIGVLTMLDNGEEDDKILAVNCQDPRFKKYHSYQDPQIHHLVKEIEEFFRTYKNLENKTVEIGCWRDAAQAIELLESAHKAYQNHQKA